MIIFGEWMSDWIDGWMDGLADGRTDYLPSSVARHLKVGGRVKLKQMYRQNIRDVPTCFILE